MLTVNEARELARQLIGKAIEVSIESDGQSKETFWMTVTTVYLWEHSGDVVRLRIPMPAGTQSWCLFGQFSILEITDANVMRLTRERSLEGITAHYIILP